MTTHSSTVAARLLGTCLVAVFLLIGSTTQISAQGKPAEAGYDRAARATLLHNANVYVAADPSSQKLSEVTPGHEVVISERNGEWMKVFANTDSKDRINEDDEPMLSDQEATSPLSGWIRDKGVVTSATPNGDMILFGAGAAEEDAPPRHMRRPMRPRLLTFFIAGCSSTFRNPPWRRRQRGDPRMCAGRSISTMYARFRQPRSRKPTFGRRSTKAR